MYTVSVYCSLSYIHAKPIKNVLGVVCTISRQGEHGRDWEDQ